MKHNRFLLYSVFLLIILILNLNIVFSAPCDYCISGCNNICEVEEDLDWCPDCNKFFCSGDGVCDPGLGETSATCPSDCPLPCTDECTAGSTTCTAGQLRECTTTGDADPCYEWSNTPCTSHSQCTTYCGADTYCNPSTNKCEAKCPNGQIDAGETCSSCPADVGKCDGQTCASGSDCQSGKCISTGSGCSQKICYSSDYKTNDGCCNTGAGESCSNSPADCGTCAENCADNSDNDADGKIDCQDASDCPAPATPCATCKEYKCNPTTYDWYCDNSPSTTSCGTKNCDSLDTTCRNYYEVTKYCDGSGNCADPVCNSYANAPSTTQCGTDTSCAYTGCSGNCLRTGTWLDYHCSGSGTCIYDTISCSATCSENTKCSAGNCISATETCGNGLDEDCDGLYDEGCPCVETYSNNCDSTGNSCGNIRATSPYNSCDLSSNVPCGTETTCDNIDNNCNGQTDEILTKISTCGQGICFRSVTQSCSAGAWLPSCTPGAPSTETCNGIDDDCDGTKDNGFNLLTDVNNCGSCSNICSFNHAAAACSGGVCAMGVCNPSYWDIDTQISTGCEYSCTKTQTTETTCNDNVDNDCDNLKDCLDPDCSATTSCVCTGTTQRNCPNQQGVCAGSKETCTNNQWPGCTYTSIAGYQADETKCDNLDNDCDGTKDEGCDDDADTYCDSSMSCSGTVLKCKENKCLDCDDTKADINPGKTEACNNLDDNCDGQKNEGNACACTTQAVLSTLGNAEIVQPSPGAAYSLGDEVYFYARSAEGTSVESYDWSLGDGSANTFQSFSHAYSSAGDYGISLKYYVRSGTYNKVCEKIGSVNIHIASCKTNSDCTMGKTCQAGVCKTAQIIIEENKTVEIPLLITINSPLSQTYAQKTVPLSITTSKPVQCSYSLNSVNYITIQPNTNTINGKEGANALKLKCENTTASVQFTVKLEEKPSSIFDTLKGNGSDESIFTIKDKGEEMKLTKEQAKDIITEITQLTGLEITKTREISGSRSLVMLSVKNLLPIAIENTKIKVTIPKSAAQSADEIESPQNFTVIENDPVIEFLVSEIRKGQLASIMFELNKVIDEQMLNDITVSPEEDFASLIKKQQETADAVKITTEFEEYEKDGERYTKITTRIKPKKGLKGMALIEKIPKCLAKQIDYIKMDEKYRSMIKVLNPDPLIMWQFEEIMSEEYFTYEVKGVLSEDCRKQIRAMGIADELGIDIESRDYFRIMLPLLAIPLAGLIVIFIHRKPHEAIIESVKGKAERPAERPKEQKKEEKKPVMEAKEKDVGKFLDKEIEEAEREFRRGLK